MVSKQHVKTAAAAPAPAADSGNTVATNVALLVVWFCTSIYFNMLTPEFGKHLHTHADSSLDITMVELLAASAYGLVVLPAMGLSVLPSRALLKPMAFVGFCHLFACRLFIMAVGGEPKIPISLAQVSAFPTHCSLTTDDPSPRSPPALLQTIRAANPIFVVGVSFLVTGARYPLPVLLSLVPLVAGFALATLSESAFHLTPFLCALGSVTILVVMSLVSKKAFSKAADAADGDAAPAPHWAQVQLWSCSIASLLQGVLGGWAFGGGPGRVAQALATPEAASLPGFPNAFVQLVVVNGAMYYAEQVRQQ